MLLRLTLRRDQRLAGLKFRGWRYRLSFWKVTIRKPCDGAQGGYQERRDRVRWAILPLLAIATPSFAR
jgi:hypothetical protein